MVAARNYVWLATELPPRNAVVKMMSRLPHGMKTLNTGVASGLLAKTVRCKRPMDSEVCMCLKTKHTNLWSQSNFVYAILYNSLFLSN